MIPDRRARHRLPRSGQVSRPVPPVAFEWRGWLIAEGVAIVAMLALGGGSSQTPLTRTCAELIGLGLLAGPMVRAQWGAVIRADRLLVCLLAALFVLLIVQLVPLSPHMWTGVRARAPFLAGDVLMFGHPVLRPLSLDPDETVASALFMVPGLALWLRLRADADFAERAIVAFLVFLGLSLTLAAVQAASGPGEYHLYLNTHSALPTGFFANRNHQAIAMDCGIVLAAMLERRWKQTNRFEFAAGWLFACATLLFTMGALLTGSRAGVALLVPSLIAGILLARGTGRRGRIELAVCLVLMGLGAIVLVVHPGGQLGAIANRSYAIEDNRYLYWPVAIQMMKQYAPWGVGFGVFPHAYEVTEPRALLAPLWLNHAHNDWLEYLVEAGLPGGVLALAFLGWLMTRLIGTRRAGSAAPLVTGAGVVILLLLAHSAYDYPLRTIALSSLFALMLGLMVRPVPVLAPKEPLRIRRYVVGFGLGAVAVAMIAECIGFAAASSATPLLGAAMPMANTRAKAIGALDLAVAHGPANRISGLALQAGAQSPISEAAFAALAMVSTDPSRTDALFAQAHLLSRHDPILLATLFERARTRHDPSVELSAFDELARQQMDTRAQDVELGRDLSDTRLRALVAESLAHGARWRGHFLESASSDKPALDNLVPLVRDLMTGPVPPTRDELAPLISTLLNGPVRDPVRAWQLWRGLSPRSDPLDWDIQGADHAVLPFDWTLPGRSAAGDRGSILYDNGDGNAPIIASKLIVLSAGAYRFSAMGDAQGIILQLECNGVKSDAGNGELVTVPVDCAMAHIALKMPAQAGTLGAVRLRRVDTANPPQVHLERKNHS